MQSLSSLASSVPDSPSQLPAYPSAALEKLPAARLQHCPLLACLLDMTVL